MIHELINWYNYKFKRPLNPTNHVVIDLETVGVQPGCAVLSIGAYRVNLVKRDLTDSFYATIDLTDSMSKGLIMHKPTYDWWMSQGQEVKDEAFSGRDKLIPTLTKFSEWVGTDAHVWGNGATFDLGILAAAYQKTNLPIPWKFYNERCLRTLKAQARDMNLREARIGNLHMALDDAKTQAVQLMLIVERYKMFHLL